MDDAATLLLVDGMAAVYRAFFAIRNLKNSSGVPTNAVFGFVRMLEQLVKAWRPTHLAVVFDGGLPAERLELVSDYKANRPPMPDALRAQLDSINEYLDAASIPNVRLDSCEADDVIATIAAQAAESCSRTLLATHDKDLFQLVNENTLIVPLAGKPEAMGPDEVAAKTGVRPEQIVDWLALIGDSADNIKGVPGVGPKTATKLLTEFGDVSQVWPHVEDIKGDALRRALKDNRDLVLRNKKMVRLDTAVAGVPDWHTFKVKNQTAGPLLAFFERMEFHAMAKALREPELF